MQSFTVQDLVKIVRKAGSHVVKNMGKIGRIESKISHSDLVTDIDRQVEEILRKELSEYGINVIGEESWKGEVILKGLHAVVDPIDGTLNFVHGLNFFSISVALIDELKVQMLKVGESRFELLEPMGENSEISKFLEKRGGGIHHIALRVDDIEAAFKSAKDMGFRIIGDSIQTGAEGRKIFFLHPKSTGGVLIEFVEGGNENG